MSVSNTIRIFGENIPVEDMNENVLAKLKILAESAKYDVSCSSSGTVRRNSPGTLGNTVGGWGICHSFAEDGRCISLLKIMLTNYCIYDCAYCINRRSNDIPRATLSVSELVDLTIEFYRRNYIEGLFLSSGVVRNPDYTMERLVRVAKDLRLIHRFNGYIHLKSIPGASRELVNEAGLYADRLSVNIEIPKEENLKLLAPEKAPKPQHQPKDRYSINKAATINPEINLLGNTVDEAIARLEKYLDDAMIAGLTSVRVVHGKGTGALRKGIHEYLRKLKFVKSYKLAEFGEGDAGVTIVTFK